MYISTLCIGANGGLNLSHENNIDLPSGAIEIPISWQGFSNIWELEGLIGINDTWLRYRDQKVIESQDELDSMQYSGIYSITQDSKLENVRNCVLVIIGKPNICCVQNLYNFSGNTYKYRVKWFSMTWGQWQTVSLTWFS